MSFAGMPEVSFLFIQFLNGLTLAMFLFLIASGLSLIFGILGVLNFAHGSLYMLGAYFTYTVVSYFTSVPLHFWLAILIAPIAVAIVGGCIEKLLLNRLYIREELYQLLFTYALVLILGDAVKIFWGTDNKSVAKPAVLDGSISIFGRDFPTYNLFMLIIGPSVALGLWLLLYKTKWGKIIRAAASDRETIGALGINVSRLFTAVFALGTLLGGLGGGLASPIGAVYPGMDVEIIVQTFIVVVIGGLGSLWGPLLGALILGQVTSFGILVFPRFAVIIIYVLMAIVLMTRPWGLLGKPVT